MDVLSDLQAWRAASPRRRAEAIDAVLVSLDPDWVHTETSVNPGADFEIAVFEHVPTRLRFSLVPGGTFLMGFSASEEALVHAERQAHLAEVGEERESYELFRYFLEVDVPRMRPVREVSVPPLLVGQTVLCNENTGGPTFWDLFGEEELDDLLCGGWMTEELVLELIDRLPFRLPSEAELEHAARAGRSGELIYGGGFPPKRHSRKTLGRRNAFGLRDYAAFLELCSDLYRPSYDGAPTDGSAVAGDGPRAVRGGFTLCSGQHGGEWAVLCSAFRQSSEHWEYHEMGARPVFELPGQAAGSKS